MPLKQQNPKQQPTVDVRPGLPLLYRQCCYADSNIVIIVAVTVSVMVAKEKHQHCSNTVCVRVG